MLFRSRPALNIGISVSRVGGNAQIKAMNKIAGPLKLDLAQYRALEAFAKFGSDLDKATQQQLTRGARLTEIMKQKQFQPMRVENQIVLIWTATNGYLDDIPVSSIKRFEKEFQAFIKNRYPQVPVTIIEKKAISDELTQQITTAVKEFKSQFKAN